MSTNHSTTNLRKRGDVLVAPVTVNSDTEKLTLDNIKLKLNKVKESKISLSNGEKIQLHAQIETYRLERYGVSI